MCGRGAEMVRTLDISSLPPECRRGLDYAIVFVMPLRPDDDLSWPSFDKAEQRGEALALWLEDELKKLGYCAFPQTLKNVFDYEKLSSPLPNKTLAVMAGYGWIGKNALLITEKYGSAISIAAVLTDAVLPVENVAPVAPRCGDCISLPGRVRSRGD